MKTIWKGGILLPKDGKYGYGAYEMIADDDSVVGRAFVKHTVDGKFVVEFHTEREIDLDASDFAFVEESAGE